MESESPLTPSQVPTDPHAHVDDTLPITQLGETTICQIKRHPIGLIAIYVMSTLLLLVVAVLAFWVAPHFASSSTSDQVRQIGAIVFLIIALICAAYGLIATKVYWGNSWVLTSDSLTQVTQTSLLKRASSQLSLDSLEDVTAEKDGILAHLFNYGVIRVETAGERSKFVFMYCPNPNYYAQQVLAARETYEQRRNSPSPYQLGVNNDASQATSS